MQNRFGFTALLAVMGVSIVFGMIIGGKLNAPEVAFASPGSGSLQLTPAVSGSGSITDFADVVEDCLPAVVGVTSTARGDSPEGSSVHPFLDDPFFRRFFGEPEENQEPREAPQRRVGTGSGFIISPDGYVMTNNHVIEDFEKVEVTISTGEVFEAEVVGTDPSIDLALLKIDTEGRDMPTLRLGDSDSLRVGEWAIAIGDPHEFDHSVTVGIISGKKRRVPLPGTDGGVVTFIQTDAAINLGNSGGPLLDIHGNVIGINTAIRRQNFAEGIGFALPINQAQAVVEQLIESGRVRRGWIGITMNEGIDETTREYYGLPDTKGVLVTDVNPDGPARKAGLEAGDVIRKVDGEPIQDNLDMISKISSHRPGDEVDLDLIREGRPVDLTVTLGDREEGLEGIGQGTQRSTPRDRERDDPDTATGLGLTVENLSDRARMRLNFDENQRGVLITDVEFKSDAERKGLRPMLVVVAVNDNRIRNVADWEDAVADLKPGSPVKLDVLAPGGEQQFYFFIRVSDD